MARSLNTIFIISGNLARSVQNSRPKHNDGALYQKVAISMRDNLGCYSTSKEARSTFQKLEECNDVVLRQLTLMTIIKQNADERTRLGTRSPNKKSINRTKVIKKSVPSVDHAQRSLIEKMHTNEIYIIIGHNQAHPKTDSFPSKTRPSPRPICNTRIKP